MFNLLTADGKQANGTELNSEPLWGKWSSEGFRCKCDVFWLEISEVIDYFFIVIFSMWKREQLLLTLFSEHHPSIPATVLHSSVHPLSTAAPLVC